MAPLEARVAGWQEKLARANAWAVDSAMCAVMFAIQRKHRLHANSREELARYIAECEPLTREAFFRAPLPEVGEPADRVWSWPSPVRTAFPKNDHAHARLFLCERGWEAPTVLMLHALMSASDLGYRRWAAAFNARGWNAAFVHLPFHYSRTPPGFANGELAITADLVRTAEGLRQGVSELRQLMALFRARGCREFGLWASSYGGWIGALLASVERDFRFIALMEPIVDVEHAIWLSPAGAALRRELRARGVESALVERHFHLASPLHAVPLCAADRVVMAAGTYDRIARAADIARLHELWSGSELLHIPQGHFGYRMMPSVWRRLLERGDL
jgi:GNAT superfamily N-acetyltransferase